MFRCSLGAKPSDASLWPLPIKVSAKAFALAFTSHGVKILSQHFSDFTKFKISLRKSKKKQNPPAWRTPGTSDPNEPPRNEVLFKWSVHSCSFFVSVKCCWTNVGQCVQCVLEHWTVHLQELYSQTADLVIVGSTLERDTSETYGYKLDTMNIWYIDKYIQCWVIENAESGNQMNSDQLKGTWDED